MYHSYDSEVLMCKSKKIRQIGNVMAIEGHRKNPNQGRVYDQRYCCPTLTGSLGGGRQPFVIVRLPCAIRGRDVGGGRKQCLEVRKEKFMNCLTTVCKDSLILVIRKY